MTNVERKVPMYVLPYMLFSLHVPYASCRDEFSSTIRSNGREFLSVNFLWLSAESVETPITLHPESLNRPKLSRKSQACTVHPDVLSRG